MGLLRRIAVPLVLVVAALTAGCAASGKKLEGGLRVEFEGLESYTAKTVMKALDFASWEPGREGALKAFADDAAFDVESYYRQRGFPDARVEFQLDEEEQLIVLVVEEHQRTVLAGIAFDGNRAFDDEVLGALASTPTDGLFGLGRPLFVRQRLLDLTQAVEDSYVANGYLEIQVEPPVFDFSEEKDRAWARIQVEEGPLYRLRGVQIDGGGALAGELETLRSDYVGKPFYPRLPFEVRGRVFEVLENAGYAKAAIELEHTVDPVEAVVDLVLEVELGRRIVIGDVRFDGGQTDLAYLRSRLAIGPGDVYDGRKIQRTFRNLHETGLFTRVGIELSDPDALPGVVPSETPAEAPSAEGTSGAAPPAGGAADADPPSGDLVRDLVVTLEEAQSLELWVEPGWGSWELLRVRAGIEEKNFLGKGMRLRAEGKVAVRSSTFELGFTDPWLFRTRYIGDLIVGWEHSDRPSFTKTELGASAILTRKWTRNTMTRAGYTFKRSDASNVTTIDDEVNSAQNDLDIASLALTQRYDVRNNVLAPSGGGYADTTLEWSSSAIGSEIDFLRPQLSLRGFHELRPGTVLVGNLRTSLIFPMQSTDVIPIQERIFNGGDTSVRSFQRDQLGPKDLAGNPTGGETATVLNAELRHKVWGSLEGAAFFDTGNVTLDTSEYLNFPDFRVGVGAGLRFLLPIGPLRLDLGINPAPRENEDRYVLHFSIGMPF